MSSAAVVTLILASLVLVGGLLASIIVGTRRSRRDEDARPR